MFKVNPLYYTDAYKISHKRMLAPGTTKLYGTWIPRSTKYAPQGISKVVSFGQQLTWQWIHDEFEENFFYNPGRHAANELYPNPEDNEQKEKFINVYKSKALLFIKDMTLMLGQEYDGKHFEELWNLGYLPIKVKSLPEGLETGPNIPHMTFVNTVDGFAWLTLFLETIVSSLAWKPATAATIALQYRRNVTEWVMKTDPSNAFLIDYLCHDFSARGLNPHDMISVGLGHATSFRGSDTLITIPAARYFYGESELTSCINSVNASEHSVSTTKIFTVGEKQIIIDWLKEFPTGILSIVADTFDLWKLLLEYLTDPEIKALIMARDGKLVIRPDSGDPVDIICGTTIAPRANKQPNPANLGVIEILAGIFGTTTNEQGYKVLDPHIGAIYGDSITLDRQIQIYERLAAKGFASTNIVLGVGSYTYQYNTRDTFGYAAEVDDSDCFPDSEHYDGPNYKSYNIYKDPVTDDGTKKSLKGLLCVLQGIPTKEGDNTISYMVKEKCSPEEESKGLLQVIYENGKFSNQTTLTEIREKLKQL